VAADGSEANSGPRMLALELAAVGSAGGADKP